MHPQACDAVSGSCRHQHACTNAALTAGTHRPAALFPGPWPARARSMQLPRASPPRPFPFHERKTANWTASTHGHRRLHCKNNGITMDWDCALAAGATPPHRPSRVPHRARAILPTRKNSDRSGARTSKERKRDAAPPAHDKHRSRTSRAPTRRKAAQTCKSTAHLAHSQRGD